MLKIVGILNITPDSFSDKGLYDSVENALEHTQRLMVDGADIVDVGAESTRPNADMLTAEQEWGRLQEILPKVLEIVHFNKKKVSLDSYHCDNIKKALELGVDMVNDVSANLENAILADSYDAEYIMMHNLGVPADKSKIIATNKNILEELYIWAEKKLNILAQKNIQNIIFDVGLGFGKNSEQSLEIIENLDFFKKLGVRLYLGHSRKSFLNLFQPKNLQKKDLLTLQFSEQVKDKVDYLRVHNVKLHNHLN